MNAKYDVLESVKHNEATLAEQKDLGPRSITFHPSGQQKDWIMKIEKTENGAVIKFNREDYPNCMEDAFAEAVCGILCRTGYLDSIYKEFYETKKKTLCDS